jgi:hypothetical protein
MAGICLFFPTAWWHGAVVFALGFLSSYNETMSCLCQKKKKKKKNNLVVSMMSRPRTSTNLVVSPESLPKDQD